MCFFSSLSFSEWMLLLTAGFTGGLLRVAWLAYERLLVQEATKKQLEIVGNLTSDIVFTQINLKGYYLKTSSLFEYYPSANIFTYARIDLVEDKYNYPLAFSNELNNSQIVKIINYLGNPLLPTEIAKSISVIIKKGSNINDVETFSSLPHYTLGIVFLDRDGKPVFSTHRYVIEGG